MQICLVGLRFFRANEAVSLFSLCYLPPAIYLILAIAAVLCFTSSCQYFYVYYQICQIVTYIRYFHKMESEEC